LRYVENELRKIGIQGHAWMLLPRYGKTRAKIGDHERRKWEAHSHQTDRNCRPTNDRGRPLHRWHGQMTPIMEQRTPHQTGVCAE
jgi:hypothetical protein